MSVNAIDALQTAIASLERASNLDNELNSITSPLKDALNLVEALKTIFAINKSKLELDPEVLQQIEERLGALSAIKRKYGPQLAQAIERRDGLIKEINKLENTQVQANEIEQEIKAIAQKLEDACQSI